MTISRSLHQLTSVPREWVALAVLTLPCLLIAIDASVLELAVPAISAQLHPSGSQLLWILDIYGFLLAGSLISMGRLGDHIGRRRLLLIGAAAFAAASVLAACSTSATMLILSRGALGIAGATLMPSTLGLIRELFPDAQRRGRAIAVWGASLSLGGALGPILGGALIALFSWRAVFVPAVPIMGLLLVLGPRTLPEAADRAPGRLDPASVTLSIATILALVFALKQFAMRGADAIDLTVAIVGTAAGAAFVARQRRLRDPLVDLALFRRPAFSVFLAANALGFALIAGIGFLVVQDLQLVHHLSPLQAGLVGIPAFAALIVGDLATPALARRSGAAVVSAGGLIVAASGYLILTELAGGTIVMIIIATVVSSLGLAPVLNLATGQVLESAPASRAGGAAGLSETSTELGFALGIALLGSLATAIYRGGVHVAAARESLGAAIHTGDPAVAHTARAAFTHALSLTAATGATIAVATAAAVILLLGRERRAAGRDLIALTPQPVRAR